MVVYRPIKRTYVEEYRKTCISKATNYDNVFRTCEALKLVLALENP